MMIIQDQDQDQDPEIEEEMIEEEIDPEIEIIMDIVMMMRIEEEKKELSNMWLRWVFSLLYLCTEVVGYVAEANLLRYTSYSIV